MFTGLVQDVGTITRLTMSRDGARLEVTTALCPLEIGESVAVDGACLSVTDLTPAGFAAFASAETIERTGFGSRSTGKRVNLEKALLAGDPLGGHIVTGHVDTRVSLVNATPSGEATRLEIALPRDEAMARQIAPKGSVAIDGVSLTVNEVGRGSFSAMVIPITLDNTTLGDLRPGDEINLETDVLAKYVARQLARGGGNGVDMKLLARSGFIE